MCVPKLTYGLELLNLSDNSMELLETFHCSRSKQIQGLPVQCANPGSRLSLGWNSIESQLYVNRLLFFWTILQLPMSCIYKVILIRRILALVTRSSGSSPVSLFIDDCKIFNLLPIVLNAITTGKYMPFHLWKKTVKEKVFVLDF